MNAYRARLVRERDLLGAKYTANSRNGDRRAGATPHVGSFVASTY